MKNINRYFHQRHFFENYFLSEGHPVLEYDWSSADGHIELEVKQVQEKGKASFEIPLGVEIPMGLGRTMPMGTFIAKSAGRVTK